MPAELNLDSKAMDELFPADPIPAVQPPAAPPAPPTPSVPAQSAPEEPYLKAGNSVYKTREAAEEGLRHKDELFTQMRQRYALVTGIDPISNQPIQANSPQNVDNYRLNPDSYVNALKGAKTPQELAAVQEKFILDTVQPMQPAVAAGAKEQALRQIEASVPEFRTFYGSAEYKAALEATPSLQEALATSEADPRFATRLPDLYKTAYLVSKGIQLPELLKKQTPQNPTPTQTSNLPVTSAPPETTSPSEFTLTSKKGRQAIIEAWEKSAQATRIW